MEGILSLEMGERPKGLFANLLALLGANLPTANIAKPLWTPQKPLTYYLLPNNDLKILGILKPFL